MVVNLRQLLVIVLALFVCSRSIAESAKSLWSNGAKAEARQDYEAAYGYYKAAYDKRPDDLKYRVAFERIRFLAAATKVKHGQQLREQGNLQEALQVFAQAAEMDPSNDLARQEIRRTEESIKAPATPRSNDQKSAGTPSEGSKSRSMEDAEEPVELCAISDIPLQSLKLTGDAKTIYETVARIAGINVLFDPEFSSRTLTIDLRGVTLLDALSILALESRSFWRPVTPNTIFVAADNTGKRRELDQNAIQTFYLGHVATTTDLQDMVSAIRNILEVQRIQPLPSQNAIMVRGTPSQLALVQKMIDDFDKVKPEVVVDVVVAQVRHDKVRQAGILPPQTASIALQGNNSSNNSGSNNNNNGLNFNALQHLTSTNYAVSISPVQAQLLLTDANTKILEKPQLRAADGVKASLKVGDRIPIATGSFGAPLGTASNQLGVNTQFQYIDVGVKIDVTPRVQEDSEVSLKVTLEISNKTGDQPIGGITQPIISQRTVDHEIQLKDGEVNLLGGILEEQTTLNMNGVPVLSRLPLLKYIFGQEDKEKRTNEVVFLLVPHIVRGRVLSALNRKRLDVGTGSSIEVRFSKKSTGKLDNSTGRDCGTPFSATPSRAPQGQPGPASQPTPQSPLANPLQ